MTPQDLDNLEALAKKATQGEWSTSDEYPAWQLNIHKHGDNGACGDFDCCGDYEEYTYLLEDDAQYIVALHNAFPDLLALARAGIKTHTETPLTRRQYQVLKIIFEELKPTLRDIQKKMGYAETSSSQRIVNILVREKFVRREKYVSGGLYITDKGREALKAYDDLTKDV